MGKILLKAEPSTEVIHVLLPRMNPDSSVLFGGRAKDRPYPGSTARLAFLEHRGVNATNLHVDGGRLVP